MTFPRSAGGCTPLAARGGRRRSTRRASARRAAGLALLLPLLLTGCLETRTDVRLQESGQGVLTAKAATDPALRDDLLRALAALYGAEEAPDPLPFADPFHPRWVRLDAEAAEGLTLLLAERKEDEGRWITSIGASFESLEGAARGGMFFPCAVRLEHEGTDAWRFVLESPWADAATADDGEIGGKPYATVAKALAPYWRSLSTTYVFHLPCRVLKTNGALDATERVVTWSTGAPDVEARTRTRLEIVFEATDALELTSFRHRPDPDALMRRLLEAPPGLTPSGVVPDAGDPATERDDG